MPGLGSSSSIANQVVGGLAAVALDSASSAVITLLGAFGLETEPDLGAIVFVYDRMLAIALLIAGAVMALGLIERITGGALGVGWNLVPRTLVAVFLAFAGLEAVSYLAGYAALLANSWDFDFARMSQQLKGGGFGYFSPESAAYLPMGSLVGLILTGLLTSLLALLVYVELLVRGALILIVTAFIPLVAVMAIWPRLAGAATHLAEFLFGLLMSKFVIATAVFIGYRLVLESIQQRHAQQWMLMGVAVLCIAAFSPLVLMQGLRFSHATAGRLSRDWAAAASGPVMTGARALTQLPMRGRLGRQTSRRSWNR